MVLPTKVPGLNTLQPKKASPKLLESCKKRRRKMVKVELLKEKKQEKKLKNSLKSRNAIQIGTMNSLFIATVIIWDLLMKPEAMP